MNKKMFLVAIGGKTKDGRYLPDEDIFAIAKNYNTEIYTAGIVYDFNFPSTVVGTVQKLNAELVDDKAHLYAEVNVSTDLLETARGWNVPYFFAISYQCGSALPSPYLISLATTPEPSIEGTDVISFPDLAGCLQ